MAAKRIAIALAISALAQAVMVRATLSGAVQGAHRENFTKQSIELNGERILIVRDSYGVPHIFARSRRAVFYGGGYAVAQDRLGQLERFRRDARGASAEIDGSWAFMHDYERRIYGNTEAELQQIFDALSPETKEVYQAYSDGINLRIEECASGDRFPEDLSKAGIHVQAPWRVTDSIAISILIAGRFGAGGGLEISNAEILNKLKERFGSAGSSLFDDLFYLNDPRSPTTVPAAESTRTGGDSRSYFYHKEPRLPTNRQVLAEVEEIATEASSEEYAKLNNLPTRLGSFCWAVGPSRTASHNPILVGGPQLGFTTPSIAHEIHYSAGDLNVIGMGIAGIPGVIIGHNDRVAWSMTSGRCDMRDVFVDELNPENKYQYLYKGTYRNLEQRTEAIKVKGEQAARTVQVYRTIHGPVAGFDSKPIEKAKIAYALRKSYSGHEMESFEAVYSLAYAKNLADVSRAVADIYTSNNICAITVEGEIGYWYCGKPPVRAPGCDPRLPVPGTGNCEWLRLMSFSEMPHLVNPAQGFIVNWNNKPVSWWNNSDTPLWGEIYHGTRIMSLLQSHPITSSGEAQTIVRDIASHDPYSEYLNPYLIRAIEGTKEGETDKRVREAELYLRAWDNHGINGSVAKTIFDAWFKNSLELIFGDVFSALKSVNLHTEGGLDAYSRYVDENLLLHALEGAESGVPLSRDYFKGRDKNRFLVDALKLSLDKLSKQLGPQMNMWGFKQGEIGFRGMPGIPGGERATYTMIVEASSPTMLGLSVLPPGQNESNDSIHCGDQREIAGFWTYKPMLYKRDQFEHTLFE